MMTLLGAIEHCKNYVEFCKNKGMNKSEIEPLNFAIKAMKKQIRKQVEFEDVGYDDFHNQNIYACICPSCGLHIIEFADSDVENSESDEPEQMFHDCMVHHAYMGLNNFCNRCGQKLKWR